MKVFIAELQENDWGTVPYTVGVYSSKELAEKALLDTLREEESVLSLEVYDTNPERLYDWCIEEFELDK